MANRLNEYLAEIRALGGLQNAILCGITISKREKSAEFYLVTDRTYTARDEAEARAISENYLPEGFSAGVRITKRVPEPETLKRKIIDFIRLKFPAAAAFLEEENVEVEMLTSGANFYVEIEAGEQTLFTSGKILDEVSRYLSSVFCGSFYGNVRIIEKVAPDASILEEMPEEVDEETPHVEIRRFRICDYEKIDGVDEPLTTAVYMADCQAVEGPYSICGTVSFIEEIEYTKHNEKTGEDVKKTRFSVALTDDTATLRCTYFPKKATLEKVRDIKIGDQIVISGANEEYKGSISFKAAKINYGTPPKGFEPVARKGKPVPKAYHTVFPEPYVDYMQA
ncbi:MAG: OB-fold nucleic acid binding domain-containing protein, partial [Clostridia bacterium]|nr:OB-fold nucleic acid binding domain-containing protein [Clostridia bacterium]